MVYSPLWGLTPPRQLTIALVQFSQTTSPWQRPELNGGFSDCGKDVTLVSAESQVAVPALSRSPKLSLKNPVLTGWLRNLSRGSQAKWDLTSC